MLVSAVVSAVESAVLSASSRSSSWSVPGGHLSRRPDSGFGRRLYRLPGSRLGRRAWFMSGCGTDTEPGASHLFAEPSLDVALLKPSDRDVQSEHRASGGNETGAVTTAAEAVAAVVAPQALVV